MTQDSRDDLSSLMGHGAGLDSQQALLARRIQNQALRLLLAACGGLCLVGGAILWLGREAGEPLEGVAPPLLALAVSALGFYAWWRPPQRRHIGIYTLVLMALVMVLPVLLSLSRHYGLNSASLGLLGLMVVLGATLQGERTAYGLFGLGLAGLLTLAGTEAAEGLQPAFHGVVRSPLWLRLVSHLLVLCSALAIGLGSLRMLRRSLQEASDRSRRFRDLLSMAADWYWEMDREFRFTQLAEDQPGVSGVSAVERLRKTPWELGGMGLSDEDLDTHRADLESHRPFSGLTARRMASDGMMRHVSISGEPRFDEQGNFRGYWGVGRDISHEVQAEQTVAATESRYRELFRRSPSPLVLHRWGRVLDANPAAMAMFSYSQRSSMIGQDLFAHYEPGDEERARERSTKLEAQPVGAIMPMAEFRLQTLARQRRLVQATTVRVDASGGPASLTFFLDKTESARAEDALRQSETLLSHLVAMSPDVVILLDLSSNRYVMVSKSYERILGYSSEEVIGRTPREVGVWANPDDGPRLSQAVQEQGRVNDMPFTCITKNGERVSILISAATFEIDEHKYLVSICRDVTEAERTRLVQASILENASIGIALTRDQEFVQVNPAVEQMFAWPPGGMVGQHASVVWPNLEEYTKASSEIGVRLMAGEQIEIEREMRCRDGSTFICRLLAKAVDPNHPSRGGTIWILEDVTERRRTEAALAQAKDEAQAANRAKSAFLANTSHEIRTPLNGMLGLARLAQQAGLEESTRRDYLSQMLESAESLSGLISDILDLSKIEAGRLTLEAVPFALREMMATIHLAYLTLAQARGLGFHIEIDEALPAWIVGDPMRLRQILSNYLSNALKFTEQGEVRVDLRQLNPEWLRIEVRDTGPGVSPEMHERLFQPFTQADESTTRRYGGTGLGLSICRELVELMGGQLGVDSALGQGATFWVQLPLRAVLAPHVAAHTEPRDAQALVGRRVLMVEDNPVNMMIAAALLEQWGIQVAQAGDGRQAIDAVTAAASVGLPFDVVLMDVQMPVMSGYEATRELRQQFSADELPIVALTAAALSSERDEALAAGMNDFLTKPIDANRLRHVLTRMMLGRVSDTVED